jgi:hypothetical protein
MTGKVLENALKSVLEKQQLVRRGRIFFAYIVCDQIVYLIDHADSSQRNPRCPEKDRRRICP